MIRIYLSNNEINYIKSNSNYAILVMNFGDAKSFFHLIPFYMLTNPFASEVASDMDKTIFIHKN